MISATVLCVVIDKATKREICSFESKEYVTNLHYSEGFVHFSIIDRAAEKFETMQKYQKSLRNYKDWYVDCCFID